jgi:hypothetical protein
MFIVRTADILHSVRSAMFIDLCRCLDDYDVALHCTPKGVRCPLLQCAINIAPLAGW